MDLLWAGTQESLEQYIKQEAGQRPTAEAAGVDLKAYNDSLDPFEEDGALPEASILTVTNGIGIINISGLLVSEDSWINDYMGWVSYGEIQRALMVAAVRPDVKTILLDISSPGGNVIGARETALMIKTVDRNKPVVGFAELAASSGYWLMSSARKRYISATGIGGSIGVVAKHVEYSKMNEKDGITETVLRAGKYKQLFNSSEPLTDEAVAETMLLLNESYRVFVQDVSNNLGVSFAQVDAVAQGREYLGQQAVDVGLFHKVSDFQEVLAALVVTEEEGGSIVGKGKNLTYSSMASAFAASAAESLEEGTVEKKVDAAEEEEPTKEEQLELDLQASVVLVAERDATIEAATVAQAESKVLLEAAQAVIDDFSVIVAQAIGNMSVALNVENTLGGESAAADILAAYNEKSQLFTAQFPGGGIAAVAADEDEDLPDKVLQSRFDAVRSKQTAAPKSS